MTVTFVLVHDTHGHAEDSTPAAWDPARASAAACWARTRATRRTAATWPAASARRSPTTRRARVPALETTTQHVLQLRRHEVEDAQDSSGLTTAAAEGTRAVAAAEDGDWVALNNRINLTNMNKEITLRYGAGAGGVAVGAPRAVVEVRQGSATGTVLTTITLNATGAANNNTYVTPDVPAELHGLPASVPGVPVGRGRADHQPRQHQLGRVQRPRGHPVATRGAAGTRGAPVITEQGRKRHAMGTTQSRPPDVHRCGRRGGRAPRPSAPGALSASATTRAGKGQADRPARPPRAPAVRDPRLDHPAQRVGHAATSAARTSRRTRLTSAR